VKRVPIVIAWSIAFAYVEAAVVEYLRALYYPLAKDGFDFPILTLAQLQGLGREHVQRLFIELARELATLVMLAAVGFMAGRNRREALAHFMIAFGVWDIFFYLWLKLFLNWPAGLMTWDLLFLLPVPWVGPVITPLIISVALILSGLIVLYFEFKGRPLSSEWADWALMIAGGAVVITAFCWDYSNIMEGGFPNPFNWPLFGAGLALSSITFLLVIRRNLRDRS